MISPPSIPIYWGNKTWWKPPTSIAYLVPPGSHNASCQLRSWGSSNENNHGIHGIDPYPWIWPITHLEDGWKRAVIVDAGTQVRNLDDLFGKRWGHHPIIQSWGVLSTQAPLLTMDCHSYFCRWEHLSQTSFNSCRITWNNHPSRCNWSLTSFGSA